MSTKDEDELLPVVPAAELAEPDDTRRWLVESIWARGGVGIIGGAPKCCKSWLGLDLALSVASGTPCLDRFEVPHPGPVLLYMAEDSAVAVRERLCGLCRRRDLELGQQPIGVITAPSIRLDLERDRRRLDQTVRRHQPRLLLLDPFVRLHRVNENDAGEVSALLGYLRELQRRHDLAVVVVHHARKNGAHGPGGQSLRGSGDFFAWVDSALSLRRQRQQLLLTVEHRAASAPPPLTLALIGDGGDEPTHLEIATAESGAPEPANDEPAIDLHAAILTALDRAPTGALARPALRATLRIRNERLGLALARLIADGKITRRGDTWTRTQGQIPAISPV
jgi:hypothetical protein